MWVLIVRDLHNLMLKFNHVYRAYPMGLLGLATGKRSTGWGGNQRGIPFKPDLL